MSQAQTTPLRAKIAALDFEITLHKQRLVGLEAARDALYAELRRVAVFPINTVPPELLSEIFVHCIAGESSAGYNTPPRLFSRVCKSWAQIAAGTPELWRTLTLDLDGGDEFLLQMASTWMQNCKGRLALELYHTAADARDDPHPQTTDLFSLIAGNGESLKTFRCSLHPAAMLRLAQNSLSFVNLEELSLHFDRAYDTEPVLAAGSVTFIDMRMLRKVALRYIPLSSISLPWSQITEFKCNVYSADEVLHALQLLVNVVRLEVDLPADAAEEDRSGLPNIVHPNVRHFCIWEPNQEEHHEQRHILEFLTLPNIETLSTSTINEGALAAFFRRSGHPPLESLSFRAPFSSSYSDWPHFAHLDQLKALKILRPTAPLLRTLFPALKQPEFLTRLETLNLVDLPVVETIDGILEDFMDMMQQRDEAWKSGNGSVARLRCVHLLRHTLWKRWKTISVPAKHRFTLKRWEEEGLDVCIGC
ncbi:F-box domain-containing protein [Mycena kentingensis (nom. inval.)]|nr:F-box domain-containing protein [Mycena kentingensis (nom. inval.)]